MKYSKDKTDYEVFANTWRQTHTISPALSFTSWRKNYNDPFVKTSGAIEVSPEFMEATND